jgi:hypothetical protein
MNTNEEIPTPSCIDVVASWLDLNEQNYFVSPEGAVIQFQFDLNEVTLSIGCFKSEGFFYTVAVFPVKSSKDKRQQVGDYLDGVRHGTLDRAIEVGYSLEDGEVRLRIREDLALTVLDQSVFELILRTLFFYAEKIFPFLICVMTGAMKPEFAIDQTLAAFKENQS